MCSNKQTALYLRISREDNPSDHTFSDSITNQRLLLNQYAKVHHLEIIAEFCDDGISGTHHERSGLNSMLKAIEDGWIKTVLIKDLSRLSRDYIHTGELLERWFPLHSVRLISVNDGIDTAEQSAINDFSPIRAVMDDWYARDISRKVRSAIYARQLAGFCTLAHLPYGYQKCGSCIIPDCVRADYVRLIFNYYQKTRNCRQTGILLDTIHAPVPGCGTKWHDTTVRNILNNTAYIGDLYLRTTQKTSYKCNKKVLLPKAETIRFPVPPIISREEFTAVQQILSEQGHCRNDKNMLAGKIFCNICGRKMVLSGNRFVCGGKKQGSGCINPSLRIGLLHEQIHHKLKENMFPDRINSYAHMIRKIEVSPKIIRVYLYCKAPFPEPKTV